MFTGMYATFSSEYVREYGEDSLFKQQQNAIVTKWRENQILPKVLQNCYLAGVTL